MALDQGHRIRTPSDHCRQKRTRSGIRNPSRSQNTAFKGCSPGENIQQLSDLTPTNQMRWEELAMRTAILAYAIALGGVAMIAFGLWELYILIRERVALRHYIPTFLTIAVGLVLIGLAQALRLLLVLVGYQ